MAIDIRQRKPEQWRDEWLVKQSPAHGIRATVLHHTWSPTAAQYSGPSTIEGIRSYHKGIGWQDIGANAYAAPDGTVYNARPLSWNNYAHALVQVAWSQVPADLRMLANGNKQFLNQSGFGIETIGNFDNEDPAKSVAMDTALTVLAMVHLQFGLPAERLFLHRDVAPKSCPGNKVSRGWAREVLAQKMRMLKEPVPQVVKFIEHETGAVVGTAKMVPGGNHIGDQGKLYLVGKPELR